MDDNLKAREKDEAAVTIKSRSLKYLFYKITSIAGECECKSGYHVNIEHVFLEIVKDGFKVEESNSGGEISSHRFR